MEGQLTRREARAAERARPRLRLRSLAVTAGITTACAVVGVCAAGGTYALLNTTGTTPGATVKAGDMGLLIAGYSNTALADVLVNPSTPRVYTLPVQGTGTVASADLTATISTASTSALKDLIRVRLAPSPGTCTATQLPASEPTLATYGTTTQGTLTGTTARTFCLYLSIPDGSPAGPSGESVPFTLTMSTKQKNS